MSDVGQVVSFQFAFQRPLDSWARWFAVVPTRSYVRVDDCGFEAVYGLWRVATVWSNIVGVERTGPYRAWKVAGPARMSWADRGLTMAATTTGGACLRFRDPVPGIDPLGVLRHPSITLAVDDLDGFLRIVEQRIVAARSTDGAVQPPNHQEGGWFAAVRAVWSWNRRHVVHEQRAVDRVEFPRLDRAGDVDDQPVEIGVGPAFHRRYSIVVRCDATDVEEAMAAIQADPNVLADPNLAPFTKVLGVSGEMRVGDRYVIEITGPWKGAVEVVDVSARSFRLATLEGHMESGTIEMRTSAQVADDHTDIEFTIESWARSHDRFLDIMYDKLGVAKALQSEMWATACDRFVEIVHGEQVGLLHVITERAR